jgi:hypothetical protein
VEKNAWMYCRERGKKNLDLVYSIGKEQETMPERRREAAHGGRTLVRAPDGTLYLVSPERPPEKLTEDEKQKIETIIDKAEEALGIDIDKELPRFALNCTRAIHISAPEVFWD